ncbi:V-type ATP synthase subunit I domain-containing protein [Aeromicrobium terrae]|uniref:Uncharacterized protein n=1 Tax=Aeromicrobium terrae TaxID=2498846 RepID=A0A5C8NL09_9ACTN|nr:hypothetical protein [Aeromicrobium terrae]TXL61806.1 hypothetical protein FHP06_03515 [Aeromicrobium terrae]
MTKPGDGEVGDSGTWKASAESKDKAKKLRIYAIVLWLAGIAVEIGAIFGLLLNDSILTEKATVDDKGVLTSTNGFPTWAFALLIALLVIDGILVVIGSMLWKKANEYDPASKADTVRFFVQNQLGAFIPIIAFLPIIILIFLNKNMDKTQKGVAGAVGIVVALAAVVLGIDFNPESVEKYTAEKQAVIQLLGKDEVFWAGGGQVYHVCGNVPDLSDSTVESGKTADAVAAGKPRLTLKLESELKACNRAVPNNVDEIVAAIRDVQQGKSEEQVLPSPDWTGVDNAPSGGAIDTLNDAIKDVKDAA